MKREEVEELFYGKRNQERRFTQDFPIFPDVWFAYAEDEHEDRDASGRLPLLLTPHNTSDACTLAGALRRRLNQEGITTDRPQILYNESVVLARFSFRELLRVALPLSDWWKRVVAPASKQQWPREEIVQLARSVGEHKPGRRFAGGDPKLLKKFIIIVGAIECARNGNPQSAKATTEAATQEEIDAFANLFQDLSLPHENLGVLWSVSRNRKVSSTVWRSRLTVKADAVAKLFDIQAKDICWAVLDTGIDATHPAFAVRKNGKIDKKPIQNGNITEFPSRVVKTYDFLRIKTLLDPDVPITEKGKQTGLPLVKLEELQNELESHLRRGRAVDWDILEPFLRVPHGTGKKKGRYIKPDDPHGTHVAGILAADWPDAARTTSLDEPLTGVCPGIQLYDLRVLGPDADEFTVIAALQFVRHLNAHKDLMMIHGVNLSMSVPHDVANFACGRTPVCEECDRVVASGVVVVTAAGNRGFNKLAQPAGDAMGDYRYISITDPGNTESVITVGSTHRYMPHTYGVSYFSSRGPTGDGRTKPDLVAPGEKIDSCSLDGDYETLDGTSMAAPHVSGAAALLLARNRELIGQPARVKEILCRSATDLGREPRFQGAGMLDVLRALQAV